METSHSSATIGLREPMAVAKASTTIYGWLVNIVQRLISIASDTKGTKDALDRIEKSQAAQSKQLSDIIAMLTPTDPVAFRIDLNQSNQGE